MARQYTTEVVKFFYHEFKHVPEQIIIFEMLDTYSTITVQRALQVSLADWLNQGGE